MIRIVFWDRRGVDRNGIGGRSLGIRIGERLVGRGDTVVGDYGTELLVVLGEGGGYCVYVHGDNVVFVVICGCDAWEVKGGDGIEN